MKRILIVVSVAGTIVAALAALLTPAVAGSDR